MTISALQRVGLVILGLAAGTFASAAKLPDDRQDVLRFLEPLWGKTQADFTKAAKLKSDDHPLLVSPDRDGRQVVLISESVRARWTPKSLARNLRSLEFDPKLGLVAAAGTLAGTASEFDALVKEMNARYGQYATRTSALEVNTYGWVFPTAALSLTSTAGAPSGFRVQVNP